MGNKDPQFEFSCYTEAELCSYQLNESPKATDEYQQQWSTFSCWERVSLPWVLWKWSL